MVPTVSECEVHLPRASLEHVFHMCGVFGEVRTHQANGGRLGEGKSSCLLRRLSQALAKRTARSLVVAERSAAHRGSSSWNTDAGSARDECASGQRTAATRRLSGDRLAVHFDSGLDVRSCHQCLISHRTTPPFIVLFSRRRLWRRSVNSKPFAKPRWMKVGWTGATT